MKNNVVDFCPDPALVTIIVDKQVAHTEQGLSG